MPPSPLTGLPTGQLYCYNEQGIEIPCNNSGQDAEFAAGQSWPQPRFKAEGETVVDRVTGLCWTRSANIAEFPLAWQEALDFVADMNREQSLGFDDWRLPNRRELRSLLDFQQTRPALPEGHPFTGVFQNWYWTSTSAAISPDHAWYVHMGGARMFYGGKDQSYMLWPVRGSSNGLLAATGQIHCFDANGRLIDCAGSGQDGEYRAGTPWPQPRFSVAGDAVIDHLTGLCWAQNASLSDTPVTWCEALARVSELNRDQHERFWRLPDINELESLVDCARARPALTGPGLFSHIKDVYWSSTTSTYEPDWAWALYMDKGATGVGQKYLPQFHIWPVASADQGRLKPDQ